MRYDMRPDKSGWTIFDINTGRTVSLGGDLVLIGVDYEEADRLVDLLNAGDSQWEAAFAIEAAAARDFSFNPASRQRGCSTVRTAENHRRANSRCKPASSG